MKDKGLIIAIDGHSSCGKSSFAKMIARRFRLSYVDTGAMYRAVTLFALRNGIISCGKLDKAALIASLDKIDISFGTGSDGGNVTYLNGEDVERDIRDKEVTSYVSAVSAVPEVRKAMVVVQRSMGRRGNLVMDGRDIGTSVFPEADIKLFMTAEDEIRAHRRYLELLSKNMEADEAQILQNLKERDLADSTREVSPLRKADDAVVLDNSRMTFDDQMAWFESRFQEYFRK